MKLEAEVAIKQISLFEQPTRVEIGVREDHELVRLSRIIKWDELMLLAMVIRSEKRKTNTGPETHYRELLGAVVLMAVKDITYREAEDLIVHYAPARYLCNLMDTSSWTVDHVTLFEFTKMLGPEGMQEINKLVMDIAIQNGLADPSMMVSDTTAQEAKIPYPNEVGLMGRFTNIMKRLTSKAKGKFTKVQKKIKSSLKKIKSLAKISHVYAKSSEQKRKVALKMLHIVDDIHGEILELIQNGRKLRSKTSKEIARLTELMEKLIPQIFYFIETHSVAPKKIIHLMMDDLYAIVRGKAGKRVEFGLKWGINRLKGGFISGFLADGFKHLSDKKFCIEAIQEHIEQFGNSPQIYGFDRGGYSGKNIKKAKKLGVNHVGIAPSGKKAWAVSETMKKMIVSERGQIEGAIGNIKKSIYGFNKPDARSTKSMVTYGHRAIIGFNLRKLVREMPIPSCQTT